MPDQDFTAALQALAETWVHGSRLGREHNSLHAHMAEDHETEPGWLEVASDAAVHGKHDGQHHETWAYALDLPHTVAVVPK
jgi:hypothetical protein